jgi:molybdopterin biosynthesis enzyme
MIDGCLTVRALDWHGSGDLRGLVGANGFIVLQPDEAPPQLDQEVDVWLLEPDLMGLPMTETNVR